MYDRFQLDCPVDVPDCSSDLFIDSAGQTFVPRARAYPEGDRASVGAHWHEDMQNNRFKRFPASYMNFECRKFRFFANMQFGRFTTFCHAIKAKTWKKLFFYASVTVTILQLLLFPFIIINFRVSDGTISKNMSFRAWKNNLPKTT